MKRNNKKGFTIVELVIVIAVIAILSAVLIPTFGGIIADANETSRDQKAKNALTEYMISASTAELGAGVNGVIVIDNAVYVVENNNITNFDAENLTVAKPANAKVLYCNKHAANSCTCTGATVSGN